LEEMLRNLSPEDLETGEIIKLWAIL
jgi:hypothetical protein